MVIYEAKLKRSLNYHSSNLSLITLEINLVKTLKPARYMGSHGKLKWADVKPAHKKGSRTDKENYRPVSILPNVSKIYERCLFKQLTNYFEDLFSKYQCGFRKGFSVANCLLPIIEKCRESLDQGGAYGALLTDLSKAFDCLPHDLMIAKLHAYGLDTKSLRFMHSYLTNRKQ